MVIHIVNLNLSFYQIVDQFYYIHVDNIPMLSTYPVHFLFYYIIQLISMLIINSDCKKRGNALFEIHLVFYLRFMSHFYPNIFFFKTQ